MIITKYILTIFAKLTKLTIYLCIYLLFIYLFYLFIYLFIYLFWFLMLYVSQFFSDFFTYFTRTIIRAPKLIFCLELFKLSTFFNSAGKSFQRIALTVLTVSKPNLLALMFRLFTVTPDLRL